MAEIKYKRRPLNTAAGIIWLVMSLCYSVGFIVLLITIDNKINLTTISVFFMILLSVLVAKNQLLLNKTNYIKISSHHLTISINPLCQRKISFQDIVEVCKKGNKLYIIKYDGSEEEIRLDYMRIKDAETLITYLDYIA
ncbi:hypothetical protein ACFQPF_16390 [Fictibacillus iocasae]|uniref:Uncharacterized protein n=1 Tax=Fictibacillus iocasae TaxID=2715437 RepID=A0ABW2NRX7_9BACL